MVKLSGSCWSGGTGAHLQPSPAKQRAPPVLPGTPRAQQCWGGSSSPTHSQAKGSERPSSPWKALLGSVIKLSLIFISLVR